MTAISTSFGMRGFEDLTPHATVCEPEGLCAAFDAPCPPPALVSVLRKYEWSNVAATMLGAYRRLLTPREAGTK